jgi:hypothetical protein
VIPNHPAGFALRKLPNEENESLSHEIRGKKKKKKKKGDMASLSLPIPR